MGKSAKYARRQRKLKAKTGGEDDQQFAEKDENENDQMETGGNDVQSDEPQAPGRKRSRRQSGEPVWEADHFPANAKFQPPTKLPTFKSVIGRVRYLTQGGKHQMKRDQAIKQVALEVESKYYHDTVYCVPLRTIERNLEKLMQTYRNGKARLLEGRDEYKVVKEYKELIVEKDKLFDVSTSCLEQKQACLKLWGVNMGEKEKVYLIDQQGPKKNGV